MKHPDKIFDGIFDFDARLLPGLRATRFFREAPAAEIAKSHAAYEAGGVELLLKTWQKSVEPNRVALFGMYKTAFERAGWIPATMNGINFLGTVRAALEAGKRFRAGLTPRTRTTIESEFPWLERRHEHIPPGAAPAFEFPEAFTLFLEAPDLDDARARWQLAAALNEVQQATLSRYLAKHFGVPELLLHAEREEALARNYFAHWSPRVTLELWRQCVLILDAVNAGIYDLLAGSALTTIGRTMWGAVAGRKEWKAFVTDLKTKPQWLLPV